jgi:signal-transduction protein with cAMP-binding, CBS, and nucleotidyltransferase domain
MSSGQEKTAGASPPPQKLNEAPPLDRGGEEFARKTDAPRGVRARNIKSLNFRPAVVLDVSATISEAIERMKESRSDCVVIQDGEKVAAIFTECDFLTKIVGAAVDINQPVIEFASSTVAILTSAATVGDAVISISDGCCRNIIITENERIAGTISDLDLITYLAESYPKETMNLPPVPNQIMDTQEGG